MQSPILRQALCLLCGALLAGGPASAKTTKKTHNRAASAKVSQPRSHSRRAGRHGRRNRGQTAIDSNRTREIQMALIREKYLQGEPTGAWDQRTQEAMRRYQSDHGWQTRSLPDARALIKLGLGPDHSRLVNPESLAPPRRGSPGQLSAQD